MMKFPIAILATSVIAAILITSTIPSALSDGDGFTLFGKAKKVKDPTDPTNKVIRLRSTCPTGSPTCFGDGTFTFSGINFRLGDDDNDNNDDDNNDDDNNNGGLTFGDITQLSTDYFVETDDDCFGGSPRYQINMDIDGDGVFDGNIFVYIGDLPNFDCPSAIGAWQSTGNLIGIPDSDTRYDLTQLGGTFYDTYSNTLSMFGTGKVLGIQLVVDSGWGFADGEQTIYVDNSEVGTSSGDDDNDNNDD